MGSAVGKEDARGEAGECCDARGLAQASSSGKEEQEEGREAGDEGSRAPGRAWCEACARPQNICLCSALPADRPLETRSRVVLFIHPKEVKRALGTAPLLKLCLANFMMHEADRFPEPEEDPELHQALCEGGRQCVLVCPGPNAEELHPPDEAALSSNAPPAEPPKTLIFVDGRWPQAKSMVNRSTWLREKLPRVVLIPSEQSGYKFRKQPEQGCLSTLEAVAEALLALEGARGPALKAALAAPFHRMVELQCGFIPEAGDKNARFKGPNGQAQGDGESPQRYFDLEALQRHPGLALPEGVELGARQTGPGPRPLGLHCVVRWGERGVAGREMVVVEVLRAPLGDAKRRAAELSQGKAHGQRCWVLRPENVPQGTLCEEGVLLDEVSAAGARTDAAA